MWKSYCSHLSFIFLRVFFFFKFHITLCVLNGESGGVRPFHRAGNIIYFRLFKTKEKSHAKGKLQWNYQKGGWLSARATVAVVATARRLFSWAVGIMCRSPWIPIHPTSLPCSFGRRSGEVPPTRRCTYTEGKDGNATRHTYTHII